MSTTKNDFPDVYRTISTEKLLKAFDEGARRVAQVISNLTSTELTRRQKPDKWSVQEIVLHLADAEIMGAARMRQTYSQPGSSFAVYDQDIWATAMGYQNQGNVGLQNALRLFESLRRTSSIIFHNARDGDWEKAGRHSEFGELTLRNLLELYADHSERHIEQILAIRSMIGKGIDFPLLLPERLY